jgi:hypothetical protein
MKVLQKRWAAVALAIPLLAAGPAKEQSDLEAQLAQLIGEGDEAADQDRAGAPRPARTGWAQGELDGKTGKSCAMTFRDGMNAIGYIGPSSGWKKGYFFVSGPSVPFTSNPRIIRVALATDGDSDQTVKAVNYPAGSKNYAILFELTDFTAALDAMDDSENIAVLEKDETATNFGQSLFSGSWTGGHAAREELRACLSAQK